MSSKKAILCILFLCFASQAQAKKVIKTVCIRATSDPGSTAHSMDQAREDQRVLLENVCGTAKVDAVTALAGVQANGIINNQLCASVEFYVGDGDSANCGN